jgi:hypothetical protein
MKKIMLFLVLLLVPFALFAQEPEVPAGVSDLMSNLGHFVASLSGLAGIVIFVTGLLVALLKVEKRWMRLVIYLVIGVLLAILTNLLNFGLFAEATWIETLLNGVGLGVVAGGISDIPTMKVLLALILSFVSLKKPVTKDPPLA